MRHNFGVDQPCINICSTATTKNEEGCYWDHKIFSSLNLNFGDHSYSWSLVVGKIFSSLNLNFGDHNYSWSLVDKFFPSFTWTSKSFHGWTWTWSYCTGDHSYSNVPDVILAKLFIVELELELVITALIIPDHLCLAKSFHRWHTWHWHEIELEVSGHAGNPWITANMYWYLVLITNITCSADMFGKIFSLNLKVKGEVEH